MNEADARARVRVLNETIEHHNYLYYHANEPTISDYEYDTLMRELMDLEAQFPSLKDAHSASQRIGSDADASFPSVMHRIRMLSLDNTYSLEELRAFTERVEKGLGANAIYVCEPKLDGVAISLHYENGILTQAITRGDGERGDEVTNNIKTIRSLPLRVLGKEPVPRVFEVRGEVIMTASDLDTLNETRAQAAKEARTWANQCRVFANAMRKQQTETPLSEKKRRDHEERIAENEALIETNAALIEANPAAPRPRALQEENKALADENAKQSKGMQAKGLGDGKAIGASERLARKNETFAKKNEKKYANPRNSVGGILKDKQSSTVARRRLDIYVYALFIHEAGKGFDIGQVATHQGQLAWLKAHRFKTVSSRAVCHNFDEISVYISHWKEAQRVFSVGTDGVVVKVDSVAERKLLGETAKAPRWAIAYKYAPDKVYTFLREVRYQVGRTGVITPIAHVEDVALEGTTVRRASLHNQDEIERLGLHENDYVAIEKSGHIIPKVMGVDAARRRQSAKPIVAPVRCPSCDTTLVRDTDKVALVCPNTENCMDQQLGRLEHFVSRAAMNIDTLGTETLRAFLTEGIVRDPGDLYDTLKDHLRKKVAEAKENEKLPYKKEENILKGLEASKQRPFSALLFGLGIPYIGRATAEVLAAQFGSMAALQAASVEELNETADIGPVTAAGMHAFLRKPEQQRLIQKLKEAGLCLIQSEAHHTDGPLSGKKIVVSGRFAHQSRETLKALIAQKGGRHTQSLSAQTDYLVIGEEASENKLKKARNKGIEILTEMDFLALIGAQPS